MPSRLLARWQTFSRRSGEYCRFDLSNAAAEIIKFSNKLDQLLNALKQSERRNPIAITHKLYPHAIAKRRKYPVNGDEMHEGVNFPTPEEYCSTKGECGTRMRGRAGRDHKVEAGRLACERQRTICRVAPWGDRRQLLKFRRPVEPLSIPLPGRRREPTSKAIEAATPRN